MRETKETNVFNNLWPDFVADPSAPRSPKIVIAEAADGLKEKTGGSVTVFQANISITDNTVELSYTLFSMPLRYHFPFMRARFPVEAFYPVTLTAHKMSDLVATDENGLNGALATIFNAPTTIEVIQRLLSLGEDVHRFNEA